MSGFSLQGVIDMHVHSNPDIRKRAYDDFELMEQGGHLKGWLLGDREIPPPLTVTVQDRVSVKGTL